MSGADPEKPEGLTQKEWETILKMREGDVEISEKLIKK
jgi:hypothetical protein